MSLDNDIKFWEWFDKTRGDFSIRAIERRAGCPRGRIGNAYTDKRHPTMEICQSVADGLVIPVNDVLTIAGLADEFDYNDDLTIREVVEYMRRLTPEERAYVREVAAWRYRTQTEQASD